MADIGNLFLMKKNKKLFNKNQTSFLYLLYPYFLTQVAYSILP